MFEFFIALFGGAYYGTKVLSDKASTKEYNRKQKELNDSADRFDALFTCKELENKIWATFNDETMFSSLHEELACALSQMPSWAGVEFMLNESEFSYSGEYTKRKNDERKNRMYRDRQVAMSILLANRGKISDVSTWEGYESYTERWRAGYTYTQLLKERQFELVEWIRSTLEKQGICLTPVLVCKDVTRMVYGWRGSRLAPDATNGAKTYLPFRHSLIESPEVTIPKPCYGEDSE